MNDSDTTFFDLGLPHLEQYFGIWAMRTDWLESAVSRVNSLDIIAHVASNRDKPTAAASYASQQGQVAIVNIEGTLTKYGSSLSDGTSTARVRRDIRSLARNPEISAIVLRIDSPGGTVAGTKDLADEIKAAAGKKRVIAYIEDMGASAAYWLASQCNEVYANATAIIGSIGTYGVITDFSKYAANEGIKVHVISTGKFKGQTTPGNAVTDEVIAEAQRNVDSLNEFFLAAVTEGRGMDREKLNALADGRVWIGSEAVAIGLVNGIESFDATLARLSQQNPKESKPMSEDKKPEPLAQAPAAATLAELKANLIGADSDFIVAQMEAEATLAQAQKAWAQESQNRLAAAQSEVEKAKAEAAKPKAVAPGVDPIASTAEPAAEYDDPKSQWDAAIAAELPKHKTRRQATLAVEKANPGLRDAMVAAYNQLAGRSA